MHLPLLVVLPWHERRPEECPAFAASAIREAAAVGDGTLEGVPACGPMALSSALSEQLLADGNRVAEE